MRVTETALHEAVIREWEAHDRLKGQVRQAMPSLGRALDDLEQARRYRPGAKVGQVWRALRPHGSKRLLRIVDIQAGFALAITTHLVDGTPVPSHLQNITRIRVESFTTRGGYTLVTESKKENN